MPAEPKVLEQSAQDQDQGEDVRPLGADDDLLAFPNMRVFHDLQISVREWTWIGPIADVLKRHNALVERLSLQARGYGSVVLCRIEGLKPSEAALAVAEIRRLAGTLNARIEHLLLRH